MFTGVGLSYSISYSGVSFLICKLELIAYLGWGRERAIFFCYCLLFNYMAFYRRGFLFLLVLGIGFASITCAPLMIAFPL